MAAARASRVLRKIDSSRGRHRNVSPKNSPEGKSSSESYVELEIDGGRMVTCDCSVFIFDLMCSHVESARNKVILNIIFHIGGLHLLKYSHVDYVDASDIVSED